MKTKKNMNEMQNILNEKCPENKGNLSEALKKSIPYMPENIKDRVRQTVNNMLEQNVEKMKLSGSECLGNEQRSGRKGSY